MPVSRRSLSSSNTVSPEKRLVENKSPNKKSDENESTESSQPASNNTRITLKRRKQTNAYSSQQKISEMFSKKRPREEDSVEAEEKENFDSLRHAKIRKDSELGGEAVVSEKTKEAEKILDNSLPQNENSDSIKKHIKIDTEEEASVPKESASEKNGNAQDTISKCDHCGQRSDDPNTQFFQGHPQDALEEFVALTNDVLFIDAGENEDITERPQVHITEYSVYDENGHLCSLDGGFIEKDIFLNMSGYLKPIFSESPDIDSESVPVKEVGPIIEWYTHGNDGGDKNMVTLCTACGEYNLMKPSAEYAEYMKRLYEKISLSKVVVEYLESYHHLEPSYEDLLEIIRGKTIPDIDHVEMTEEMLHRHAEFICDQVVNMKLDEDDDDCPPLITAPCMRELIKLMGIKFGKKRTRGTIAYKKKAPTPEWTKATTTPLVRRTFEAFFSNQLDEGDKDLVIRRKRCGVCEPCQLPDCGQCQACKAMAKFGGHGRTKKACVSRICPNMAVQQAEDSDPEEDYKESFEKEAEETQDGNLQLKLKNTIKKIEWIGDPLKTDNDIKYYSMALINDLKVTVGDFVMVEASRPNIPTFVIRVSNMWEEMLPFKMPCFHGQIYMRASETILGDAANTSEVMITDRCCHKIPLSSIIRLATVKFLNVPNNWFDLGGKEENEQLPDDDGQTYYCRMFYEHHTARFENIPEEPKCMNESRRYRFCPTCMRSARKAAKKRPQLVNMIQNPTENNPNRFEWTGMQWRDWDYKKGQGVFLKPGTFKIKSQPQNHSSKAKLEKVDDSIYTEYYRKSDSMRGSNNDTEEPFCIGHIVSILSREGKAEANPAEIYLKVNVMYRPENTKRKFAHHEDLNLVYWTNEVKEVRFADLQGHCHLVFEKNIPSHMTVTEWSILDPNRFYFNEAYNPETSEFCTLPHEATCVGGVGKEKGKGKGKSIKGASLPPVKIENVDMKITPLRTLDVFAGCGGLSEGLHQTGIADCRWAIEFTEPAARAYQLNNKDCIVFGEDCNGLLKDVISGATHSAKGLKLPMKGDIELLCGGPPCQGFSGMNRFNSREYSNFKNSLVVSFLSYCDYYRPKYFILENVRNFVAYKRGMVLKLTLKCLLDMGYQCTFGIVQAGSYGVPQTRRRLIILAAAPGYRLPFYPEPTHVFSKRACTLNVMIDNKKFSSNIFWKESAPRRTCTIKDAMSDLPQIGNGANKLEIDYGSMPESHFQRLMRGKNENLRLHDHVCKNMAPLIQARIMRIPTLPGSDWRDLPNIEVALSDGIKSKVLQYRHHDKKNGHGQNGQLRGVCPCASGRPCDLNEKQENTLIPWCLPHTGNRHNNWAGLYGRVSWEGYFSTTVTDPEPMGKQGRILHPEQNRVVSVRECARSQGFPDCYKFSGSVQDKHRQIGNAVPPPLGAALGREIKKALLTSSLPMVQSSTSEETIKKEDPF